MKKKLPDPKLVSRKEYKYDRAMLEAIKLIPKDYPVPISMVSNVAGFQNENKK